MTRIYEHFDIAVDGETRKRVAEYQTRNPQDKHGQHHYTPEQYGLDADRLRERFGPERIGRFPVALLLGVSFLLAAMTMGVVVANLARHHRRPFRAIEGIEWPFMVLFFVLSGASLQVAELGTGATLTFAYVVLRVLGRVLGGWLGSLLSGRSVSTRAIGVALLPQAGIAIGMGLVVATIVRRPAENTDA